MTRVLALLLSYVMLLPAPLWAATYYVNATGGNDSRTTGQAQVQGTPWLTIQKCVDNVAAGDTCLVEDGTYTDGDGNGIVVYVNTTNGTSGSPITIKSTNQYGAKLTVSSAQNGLNAGFYIAKDYYIISRLHQCGQQRLYACQWKRSPRYRDDPGKCHR